MPIHIYINFYNKYAGTSSYTFCANTFAGVFNIVHLCYPSRCGSVTYRRPIWNIQPATGFSPLKKSSHARVRLREELLVPVCTSSLRNTQLSSSCVQYWKFSSSHNSFGPREATRRIIGVRSTPAWTTIDSNCLECHQISEFFLQKSAVELLNKDRWRVGFGNKIDLLRLLYNFAVGLETLKWIVWAPD